MISPDQAGSRLSVLNEESEAFRSRFVRVSAQALAALGAVVLALGVASKNTLWSVCALAGIVIYGGVYGLTVRGSLIGRRVFVHSLPLMVLGAASVEVPDSRMIPVYVMAVAVALTLAGFLLTGWDLLVVLAVGLLALGYFVRRTTLAEGWGGPVLTAHVATGGLIVVQLLALWLFTRRARSDQTRLSAYVGDADHLTDHARRIATGDLAAPVEGESDMSEVLRGMVGGLRRMVLRTREATSALSASTREIEALARQQEQGAVDQASAVTEVLRALTTLLGGSRQAAQSTEEVFRNVELTQRTSEVVAQRAAALSGHTRRISAILETIKSIANKSEILALNAALEGARAGEAGRGFSLVASQMQRLAESVTDSVRDVRGLVEDIEAATAATLAATDESTQLSARATGAAREITVTLQQQRVSTEQVSASLQDIQRVTAQVSAGSSQSLAAARDLGRLAGELERSIEGFQLG